MLSRVSAPILALLAASWPLAATAAEPTYWQDVRPVLRKHCTVCHNQRNLGELDVSGGVALDSYEAVLKGTKRPVIKPGMSDASLLVAVVTSKDADRRMPLDAEPLPAETIELLRRWIDGGAPEGTRPKHDDATPAAKPAARARKLDVALPTNAVPPKGLLGPANPAKLELVVPAGPLAPATAVAFSPDGKLLAAGSYRQVTVWDLAAARPTTTLTGFLGAVNDIRFSPNGKLLAVAGGQPSARGDLRLYGTGDWKLLATLGGHDDVVFSVAFSADGKRLASASFDKTVRVWDVAGRKPVQTLTGHSDFVYAVAFGPGGWLASASKDRSVRLSDAATGKGKFTLSGMNEDVLAVAVSPDGKSLVSSGFESALYWWDPQTGRRVRTQGGHGVAVHELSFSTDGKWLVSAGADRTVRLWNGSGGAAVRTFPVGSSVYAAAISPDGKTVASGSFDGLVRLWDAASGRHLLTLLSLPPVGKEAEWLALTPEGYAAGSPRLAEVARWRMGRDAVSGDVVWKALGKPELVARAARGGQVAAPTFGR